MINALTVFVYSWLWRVAGRGGFPHALWIRKIVVPFIVFIQTSSMATSLLISAAAMLPITYEDNKITEKNTWWLWAVGAVYGLGVAFLFSDLVTCLTAFIVTTSVFACGAMVADYTMDEYAEDVWHFFEYGFGAFLGLSVILT